MICILHQRWETFTCRVYRILGSEILKSRALNDAINNSWSPGRRWRTVSEQIDHWVVSETAPQDLNFKAVISCDNPYLISIFLTRARWRTPVSYQPSFLEINQSHRVFFDYKHVLAF